MFALLDVLFGLLRASLRTRSDLVLENLLLRPQLAILTRPTRKRPPLRRRDKLVWILVRRLRSDWRHHLIVVRPETVIRWHRRGWQLFWWWRSRSPLGRPRLSPEVRALIARMSRETPLCGAERIRGELLKLGIVVSARSIRRVCLRRETRPPTQGWRTFLANHRPRIWAADFLTVHTLAFKVLYVLLFVAHDRREIVHVNVTASPTAAWVWASWCRRPPGGACPGSWCEIGIASTARISRGGRTGSESRPSSRR
jgi:hypothetical protein